MRILVQVVKQASCSIDGKLFSSIGRGFLFFVGFTHEDNEETIRKMARKASKLRIIHDEDGKMNKSILDVGGEVLSISQFTLYADCRNGNRPDFLSSMKPDMASKAYDFFNKCLEEELGKPVQRGVFGADMEISLANDGPTTIILDSERDVK